MHVRVDFGGLKRTRLSEYALRFFFGGTVTLLAAVVAKIWGPAIGGLFLAFPAIFPAGLTLLAKHEERKRRSHGLEGKQRGRKVAALDARGAINGTFGLVSFACVACVFLRSWSTALVLCLATIGWFIVSVAFWFLSKKI